MNGVTVHSLPAVPSSRILILCMQTLHLLCVDSIRVDDVSLRCFLSKLLVFKAVGAVSVMSAGGTVVFQ